MFKEIVEIEEVKPSGVIVKFQRKSMCSCCSMRFVCASDKDTLFAANPQGFAFKPGDKAELSLAESANIWSSILVFAVPAILFVIFLWVLRTRGELISFSVSLLVIGLYFVIMNKMMKITGKHFCYVITAKL